MDWLNWAAVVPVSEKLRCCVFGGIFVCKSDVQVCVPPDTLILFDLGTAETWAVRPPLAPRINACCASVDVIFPDEEPFVRLM